MKKQIVLAVLVMMGFSSLAFGDEVDKRFIQARKYLKEHKLEITKTSAKAFTQDAIVVTGEGVGKPTDAKGQKRMNALTAAKLKAQRSLVEILEGVSVVSETKVKDSELVSDEIKTAVAGFLKGAEVVFEDWNEREETALVIMKVGMNGPGSFGAMMYEKILNEPKLKKELEKPAYVPPADVPPPAPSSQAYDGLVIDATSYSFRPALINRIFNSKGEVLYDPAKISQKVLVEQGCGEYTNSVDKARAALGKRGAKNPLVVKASGTISPSDLQVSDSTAVQIFTANQGNGFMADARVAFVLK